MPQKMIERSAVAYLRATVRMVSASMPQTGAMSSGLKCLAFSFTASKFSVIALHVLHVDEAFLDYGVDHGAQQRDVGARLELQHVRGVARQPVPARDP